MLNRLLPGIMKGVMWFGACILGIIMILITVDVCLRYFFHSPIQGSYELVEVLMGMLSPVVITYCAWHRGHVGVDLFFDKFPSPAKRCCVILTSLICTLLSLGLTICACFLIRELYLDDITTSLLFIPWWPVGVVIFICFLLMTVVEARVFLKALTSSNVQDVL
mgnify:CR=1 FL=1